MSLKSYFSVVEKARKPERESPTRTEPHDGTDSSTSDEGDDEMVASAPKRIKSTRSEQVKLSKSKMSFNSRWLNDFPWVRHDPTTDGAYCSICEKWGKPPPQKHMVPGCNSQKKAKEKMCEHAKSN